MRPRGRGYLNTCSPLFARIRRKFFDTRGQPPPLLQVDHTSLSLSLSLPLSLSLSLSSAELQICGHPVCLTGGSASIGSGNCLSTVTTSSRGGEGVGGSWKLEVPPSKRNLTSGIEFIRPNRERIETRTPGGRCHSRLLDRHHRHHHHHHNHQPPPPPSPPSLWTIAPLDEG